jgi:hypothetical protein
MKLVGVEAALHQGLDLAIARQRDRLGRCRVMIVVAPKREDNCRRLSSFYHVPAGADEDALVMLSDILIGEGNADKFRLGAVNLVAEKQPPLAQCEYMPRRQ